VDIEVSGGGLGVGLASLRSGGTDIACASRAIKDAERQRARAATGKETVESVIAHDALAVCVHKSNAIDELTLEQLARVYALGEPTGAVRDFLAWVASPAGQKVVSRAGYMAAGKRP